MAASLPASQVSLRRSSGSGYSLIEVMVTLVVIGVVSAIAIPNLKEAIKKARHRAAYQSIRTIERAMLTYQYEHDQLPSTIDTTDLGELVDAKTMTDREARKILASLDQERLFWYFAWGGWRGSSDYWYGIAFRPKGDPPDVWCYIFPDGMWRWSPTEGWHEVQ